MSCILFLNLCNITQANNVPTPAKLKLNSHNNLIQSTMILLCKSAGWSNKIQGKEKMKIFDDQETSESDLNWWSIIKNSRFETIKRSIIKMWSNWIQRAITEMLCWTEWRIWLRWKWSCLSIKRNWYCKKHRGKRQDC